jgi:hypothetical protein
VRTLVKLADFKAREDGNEMSAEPCSARTSASNLLIGMIDDLNFDRGCSWKI